MQKKKSIDNNKAKILSNYGAPTNHAEDDSKEDCELLVELDRLLEQKKKEIHPYQELVEVINLGTEEARKEVKIRESLEKHVHTELVKLLQEYVDVFS